MSTTLQKLDAVKSEDLFFVNEEDRLFCESIQRAFQDLTHHAGGFVSYLKQHSLQNELYDSVQTEIYFRELLKKKRDVYIQKVTSHFANKYKLPFNLSLIKERLSIFSVTYQDIVRLLAEQVGTFDFSSISKEVIKQRWKEKISYSVKEDHVKVNGSKLTISELTYIYKESWSNEYTCRESSIQTFQWLFDALSLYESGDIRQLPECQNYYQKINCVLIKESDGIFNKVEFQNTKKVTGFRVYKNGKLDIWFSSHSEANGFSREYCGLLE